MSGKFFIYVLVLSAVSFSFLLMPSSEAQTQLGPGMAGFQVTPVILEDVPFDEGQYCGNPKDTATVNKKLALVGDADFLNVRWKVRDPQGAERQIGTQCWLNCPANSTGIITTPSLCNGYQVCNFTGPTGDHACSIQQPQYRYNDNNTVICRFYDVVDYGQGLESPNRTFRLVDMEVSVPPLTITVGSETTLPVSVKSFGILENSYLTNTSALNDAYLVSVKNAVGTTSPAKCGEVVQSYPSILFLAASRLPFSILTHNQLDNTVCSADDECNYLDSQGVDGACVNSMCWEDTQVNLEAGLASLPDFPFHLVFVIFGLAAAVVFAGRRL